MRGRGEDIEIGKLHPRKKAAEVTKTAHLQGLENHF
jgi:hypothetical protein